MQPTSALYNSIISETNHWFEYRIVTDVKTFGEDEIKEVKTTLEMFSDSPQIGRAVAGEITATVLNPSVTLPTMAKLRLQVRAKDATRASEWIPQGVFYIDTREVSQNYNGENVLTIHGFDDMLKAEQEYVDTGVLDWSSGFVTDVQMVEDVARIMGVNIDSRTYDVMNQWYSIPLPVSYSLREILGYIASMYVGCFIMTEEGKLRLVSMLELPPETNYLIDESGFAITFGGDRILV